MTHKINIILNFVNNKQKRTINKRDVVFSYNRPFKLAGYIRYKHKFNIDKNEK